MSYTYFPENGVAFGEIYHLKEGVSNTDLLRS